MNEEEAEYLRNEIEQLREAVTNLRTIALQDHDYTEYPHQRGVIGTGCPRCEAAEWFGWNFN